MIDKMVGEFIEETCVNPTFITGWVTNLVFLSSC